MKKRVLFIIILAALIGFVYYGNRDVFNSPSSVRAFGDLTVDFGVPPGDPIFVVENMAPRDSIDKDVIVTNGGTIARMVAVKSIRVNGAGDPPLLEEVLEIVIKNGVTDVYGGTSAGGAKTVADFFDDSADPNGILLNIINPSDSKTYNFKVSFPTAAGNEFQNKSVIFDLTFGIVIGEDLVINEVYYIVDSEHGLDSPKDRGILGVSGNKVTISGNAAGSKNTVVVSQRQACKILQSNTTNISTNIFSSNNSGGNRTIGNVVSSVVSVITGKSKSSVSISIGGSSNVASFSCGKMLGQNDEWVELFNTTDQDISLKNWTLTDNSGTETKINANKKIKAGGFALLSKSSSTWRFWEENKKAEKIQLGRQIGDGLDNEGDHLILKNPQGEEVDRMSWGSDTSGFTPPEENSLVPLGSSTERKAPGFDTDTASDWEERTPPTPGE